MTQQEFKKIARLLKRAYAELEEKALKQGIDILSDQYVDLVDQVRNAVLQKAGFTLGEYREAKATSLTITGTENNKVIESIFGDMESKMKHLPTKTDVEKISNKLIKKNLKPPQIINKIVKEIPQIIKETRVEKTVEERAFNEEPMNKKIDSVTKRVDKIPKVLKQLTNDLRKNTRNDFGRWFEHNIDTLGMPDFRKLAMGLQSQIDDIDTSSGGIGTPTSPTSGTVDGSNTDFDFASKPNVIVSDGISHRENKGWTWAGSTVTLAIPPIYDLYAL